MENKGALAGVKVLDLTTVVAGPMVAGILCDMGADVIKIEGIDYPGDSYRFAGSFKLHRTDEGKELMGGCYYSINRGKRCICINLKTKPGMDIFLELVKKADVLMMNMRPAAAGRLGIGYEQLKKHNPDIVYCASTGWGPTGPYSLNKAYDALIQSVSGIVASEARPARQGTKEMHLVNHIVMDKTCAMTSAQAILAALYARAMGRGGQKIDINMLDAGMFFNWVDLYADNVFLDTDKDYKAAQGIVPEMFGIATTKDGKFVTVVTSEAALFAKAFDRPDIRPGQFVTVRDEMVKEIAKFTLEEVMARFEKYDMARSSVYTTADEVLEDPQVKHNEIVQHIDDPHFGRIAQAAPPHKFSNTPSKIRGPAPLHGEHTAQVLRELGHSQNEIDRWGKEGAIGLGGGQKSKL